MDDDIEIIVESDVAGHARPQEQPQAAEFAEAPATNKDSDNDKGNDTDNSLRFEGDFRIRNIVELRDRLFSALQKKETGPFAIDLAGVVEFDTAGVQLLLSLKQEADDHNRPLTIVAMSEPVERLLTFYRLTDHFSQAQQGVV